MVYLCSGLAAVVLALLWSSIVVSLAPTVPPPPHPFSCREITRHKVGLNLGFRPAHFLFANNNITTHKQAARRKKSTQEVASTRQLPAPCPPQIPSFGSQVIQQFRARRHRGLLVRLHRRLMLCSVRLPRLLQVVKQAVGLPLRQQLVSSAAVFPLHRPLRQLLGAC